MKMFMWIFSLVVSSMLFGSLGISGWARAQGASSSPGGANDVKTTITSKKMTVKNQENRAVFEGAVVLTRGPLIVHSDVMVVTFKASGPTGSSSQQVPAGCRNGERKPSKAAKPPKADEGMPAVSNRSVCLMEATGHVVIEKDDGRATSSKARYFVDDQKIILTGDPVACQRGTRVSGDKITMFLDEDRSEVEGGSQVLINPDGGRC